MRPEQNYNFRRANTWQTNWVEAEEGTITGNKPLLPLVVLPTLIGLTLEQRRFLQDVD